MPDEDTGLLKQIAALREEKARLVSAENYLAAAAVKRDLTELENKVTLYQIFMRCPLHRWCIRVAVAFELSRHPY
jgi:hypothetical protein